MNFIKPTLLALSLGLTSLSVSAAIQPSSYGGDSRIQFLEYNANEVYAINTEIGISTLIQLEEGEYIEGDNTGLGMGDPAAWALAVKGNNIFIKPADEMPDTNMIIVTNRRTYAIQLTTNGYSASYVVRFKYGNEKDKQATVKSGVKQGDLLKSVGKDANNKDILIPDNINTNYYKRGEEVILPSRVWDDGLFTFLKYPNAKDLPVAYRVLPDKSEAIINSHISDDVLVIHGTNPLYRLRFGKSVGEIHNGQFNAEGYFNETGTSDKSTYREVK